VHIPSECAIEMGMPDECELTTQSKPGAQVPKKPWGPPQGSPSTRAHTRQHLQGSHTVPPPLGQSASETSSHSLGLHTQLKDVTTEHERQSRDTTAITTTGEAIGISYYDPVSSPIFTICNKKARLTRCNGIVTLYFTS